MIKMKGKKTLNYLTEWDSDRDVKQLSIEQEKVIQIFETLKDDFQKYITQINHVKVQLTLEGSPAAPRLIEKELTNDREFFNSFFQKESLMNKYYSDIIDNLNKVKGNIKSKDLLTWD